MLPGCGLPAFLLLAEEADSYSAKSYVERHHDGEANHEGDSGEVRVAAFLGLGNKLLGDDEDHRTRREGEGVGQQRLGDDYGDDTYKIPATGWTTAES